MATTKRSSRKGMNRSTSTRKAGTRRGRSRTSTVGGRKTGRRAATSSKRSAGRTNRTAGKRSTSSRKMVGQGRSVRSQNMRSTEGSEYSSTSGRKHRGLGSRIKHLFD